LFLNENHFSLYKKSLFTDKTKKRKKESKELKKNENSIKSLIKVTFSKNFEMCVCKTLFKIHLTEKNLFYGFHPPVFKKSGGGE
jgi:hypothetical protein